MERSLDEAQNTEEVTEETGHSETTESEEAEVKTEDESLDALAPSLSEKQKQELETLKKKAQDFDGLAAKKRKIGVAPAKPTASTNVTEDSIRAVLYKDNEKKALKESIDPKSPHFIAELVEDKNFVQIVSYLPRSVDRSSPEAINRALKLATKMWKEDNGVKDEKKKPEAEMVATRGAGSGGERGEVRRTERTFLKKQPSLTSWYAKE